MGYYVVKFFSEEDGCKVVGIIECDGVLINFDGLNVEDVCSWIIKYDGVKGFLDVSYIENGVVVMEEDCDILILVVMEGVINFFNVDCIKVFLIIEVVNGLVIVGVDKILCEKGCVIILDMYVNVGGVIVFYFEWVKNFSYICFGCM